MGEINREWEVSVHDVKGMFDRREPFLLLDVREPDEHAVCRIEGAMLAPLSELDRHLDEIRRQADGKPVVAHCHHGMRSLNAAAWLRQAGIEQVRSMAGGIDGWAVHVDPAVPRY